MYRLDVLFGNFDEDTDNNQYKENLNEQVVCQYS
jgi:hypothetical protein